MRKWLVFLACLGLIFPPAARADITIAARYVPQAQEISKTRFRFLFWDVYDAALYAPEGQWRADAPYALALSYLRAFNGADIAQRSVDEMRGQGFADEDTLTVWYEQMARLFPDVDDGTTLTGIRDVRGHAIFYENDRRIGAIEDPAFSDWFFGIWLNEATSQPALRKKLLGLSG